MCDFDCWLGFRIVVGHNCIGDATTITPQGIFISIGAERPNREGQAQNKAHVTTLIVIRDLINC